MSRYLLDTNALSEPIKPAPNIGFMRQLQEHRHACAIASVSWHEALYGLSRMPHGRRRQALEEYLYTVVRAAFPMVPYGTEAAEWHAQERARLMAVGRPPPFADGQIAAIAKVHGLVLVSANLADMRLFDGVDVVSWHG